MSTIRITRVQVDELDPGPMPVPFQDSTMGPFTHWKLSWLRLTADDGTVGQAPTGVPAHVLPILLNSAPLTLDAWWEKLYWALRNDGHRSPSTSGLIGGIDMAMRDILAQRTRQPWHRFAGAKRDAVPVYASGCGTNMSVEELLAEARDFVRSGFTTMKMKVGKDFGRRMDEDVARVRAVREAIGPDMGLAVDANQVWSAEDALRFAKRIADLNIAWFEEPVHSADRAATREISRTCPFPVAMGESENHWLGHRDLAECGVQHPQPNPGCLPGFNRWLDALAFDRAGKATQTWTCGGMTHLMAMYVATQGDGTVEYLRAIIGHLATCWLTKPRIENGLVHLPNTPGLPVAVDWESLAQRGAVRLVTDATPT